MPSAWRRGRTIPASAQSRRRLPHRVVRIFLNTNVAVSVCTARGICSALGRQMRPAVSERRLAGWLLALSIVAAPDVGGHRRALAQGRFWRVDAHAHTSDSVAPVVDRGIGVLYFRTDSSGLRRHAIDSMALYADTSDAATLVGYFLESTWQTGGFPNALATTDSLRPNVVEFDYEVAGLPFDRLSPSGRWARALIGFDRRGRVRRAWVRLGDGVGWHLWRRYLREHALFFLDSVAATFFSAPGGARVQIPAPAGGATYRHIMYPEIVRGPWMRVRMLVPSDYCAADPEPRREYRVWIRYLRPDGRPRVWYHSRGC